MIKERKRRYYSISNVAEMTGLKTHILRFWEGEFSMLRPRKNRAGNRTYTERDIKIVGLIKKLLYEEKYTIQGEKKRLKEDREQINIQLSLSLDAVSKKSEMGKPEINEIRSELLKLIEMVKEL